MDFWHFFFIFTTLVSTGAAGICFVLLRRMDSDRARMENFVIRIGQTISDFKLKIDSLFQMSIHYYDETIYDFVENTKNVKKDIDEVLNEYEDLREFIVTEPTPEEKQAQEQYEVLGVVRPPIYPVRK